MALWRPWENAPSHEEMVDEPVQAEFFHKDLEEQTQRVILNMYDCLKNENPDSSQNQILNRICILTKISRSTIYRVIKRGDVVNHFFHRKRIGQKLKRIDVGFQEDIRRIIYGFYKENLVPTLEMIRDKLKDYPEDFYNYKCIDSLHCIVKLCGFQYKKLDKRMVIMKSSRIVELRQEFLHKVKIYREQKRNLIYLDETWYDTHDVVQYGWVDDSNKCILNAPCNRGKRIIILHAGSENGFIPNALLLSAKNIKESCGHDLRLVWIEQQLIPNISPNSVIIMDNAPYHSRQKSKIPNTGTKKQDIIDFMKDKGMEIPQKSTKAILLDLIKRQKFEKEYVVDNLLQQNGHEVLRLPPYYCIFNPIELVWAALKKNESLLATIRDSVSHIAATDLWKQCSRHIIEKENEYCVLPPVNPVNIFLAIIYYNFQRQISQQECLAELLSVFGNEAIHQSIISRWYGELKRAWVSLSDHPRVGIEASMKISKTSIQKILLEELGVVATFVSTAGHIATIPLNEQRTVTADWFTTICFPKVITELRKINPETRIILHQDNASLHTAQRTRQYLTDEKVELLDHPPYSPDLSPNDFFTFPKIINRLLGQTSPEEAVDAFKNSVLDLPANEWNKCFENWFERMQMCINLRGEYFERQ
ncbi:unnamed protein product [Acanthoscelides obtectus]|uniref:Tc1-like transposase DDE domain-containing protein n=1 Tax=Acanthoscelides obtectus TaxID=200917 RepID=A0A9P0MF69_ACAOB|nr:unnamed protein product [Acanthoscelides obtectus]CAK1643867.1 Histone-lysine N-methyltransferase SETMAR [Acanthoscelides obtectus]